MPAAREFAQFGIRVNAIAPGIFHTPMLMALPEEAQASLAAAVPFPKLLGRPDQFASLARHIIENALHQRRGDPPRRRAAHGAALNEAGGGMLVNTRAVRIEWGDCDPAGIVFTRAISRFSTPAPRR